MAHSSNHGFSAIAVIAIVVLIGLLGFVGWRVWEANQAKPSDTEQKPEQSSQGTTPPSPPEGKFLTINELGIKIKLSEGIHDLIYSYKELSDGKTAYFSTASLKNNSNGECSEEKGPLGSISKTNQKVDPVFGREIIPDGQRILQFDEYFFILGNPQAPCSEDTDLNQEQLDQRKAFSEAFKTIQAVD